MLRLKNVDLSLAQGHSLGIVGESGAGKSSLALAVARLIESRGQIQFGEHDLNKLSQKALRPLRRDFQIVFQDPFASLNPRMSVEQIIAEGFNFKAFVFDIEITQQVEAVFTKSGVARRLLTSTIHMNFLVGNDNVLL